MGVFGVCGERGEFWSVWPGGEGEGGCWRKEERGGRPGEGAGEREGLEGRRRIGSKGGSERTGEERRPGEEGRRPAGASETTWSERRKETATGKGCGSLVNSRPGSGAFLTLEIFAGWVSCGLGRGGVRVFGFSGVCFVGVFGYSGGCDLDGKDIITIFVQQS